MREELNLPDRKSNVIQLHLVVIFLKLKHGITIKKKKNILITFYQSFYTSKGGTINVSFKGTTGQSSIKETNGDPKLVLLGFLRDFCHI